MSEDTWLTDHLLGEGDATQRAERDRRIAADPRLRALAAQLRNVTDRLDALPAGGWTGLDADDDAPQDQAASIPAGQSPQHDRRRPRRRRRALALGGLVSAIVFAAGLGTGALVWSRSQTGRSPVRVTVALSPLGGDRHAHGIARVTAGGQLQLTVSGLPATPTGQYYEAWLMTTRTRLVSLASFRVRRDGQANMDIALPAAISAYRYVDVSLQRAASGPSHSNDSVLRGPTGP